MQNIEGVELTIYNIEGDNFSIPLNSIQTLIILKILGFEFNENQYSMFDDKTLNKIIQMKGNPLNLKKKGRLLIFP